MSRTIQDQLTKALATTAPRAIRPDQAAARDKRRSRDQQSSIFAFHFGPINTPSVLFQITDHLGGVVSAGASKVTLLPGNRYYIQDPGIHCTMDPGTIDDDPNKVGVVEGQRRFTWYGVVDAVDANE